MVDSETIETKIADKKEKVDGKIDDAKEKFDEKKDEQKDKYAETKEKGKTLADNVVSDLSKTIEEIKENLKNMQKAADQKYSEYKRNTVKVLEADLVETKVAVPGVEKENILIEAGDNDISIEATFPSYIDDFTEEDGAEVIMSSIKQGRCVKTIRFETSIDIENITAKFDKGMVYIELPKLIIPKHKINVE